MPSPQAQAIIDSLRQLRDQIVDQQPTIEEQRAAADAFSDLTAQPEGVTVGPVDAGGVPAYWIDPEGAAPDRVLLYVHGGGYVIMSARTHEKLVGHLARAAGCRALNVDYRLAPEHPHPAAVTDATTAYRWLLDQGFAPEHIAIAGDSAGGGLTLATLVKLRDDAVALPAGAVPISPWTDMEGTGASMTANAERDYLVNVEGIKMMADAFLQGGDTRDPLASPLYADLAGLPPLYVQVGGDETLLDDSLRLVERAQAAGVDATVEVFPEMQHVFQMAAGTVPEADDAVAKIGAWLRARLGL